MSNMKDLDRRLRQGGDDAIAAACELAGIAKERRGYEDTKNATGDITDIVTVLRGVGFAAVSPSAGHSASLLHYCVTHAADEIEHLRESTRWISVSERLPEIDENVLACNSGEVGISHRYVDGWYWDVDEWHKPFTPSHWMPLPKPPNA